MKDGLGAPSCLLTLMDRLTDEVRRESPRTIMFADDVVICRESWELVEEDVDRWREVVAGQNSRVHE